MTNYYALTIWLVANLGIVSTLFGCSPMVTYEGQSLDDPDAADSSGCEVIVYLPNMSIPSGGRIIGEVFVGDTGFTSTSECGLDDVLLIARNKACEVGGNFLQIKALKEPSVWGSTCYRIEANIGVFDFSSWETISRTEEDLYRYFDSENIDPIEGIWTESKNKYRLAIVKDDDTRSRDYVGYILMSEHPLWSYGQVKIELNRTTSWNAYTGNYFLGDHSSQGTTMLLSEGALLEFELDDPYEDKTRARLFLKNYPLASSTPNSGKGSVMGEVASSGSGFIVSKSGYLITNHHVIDGCRDVTTTVNGNEHSLSIEGYDRNNDLALLKLDKGFSRYAVFSSKKRADLGEQVMVAGFPLPSVLSKGLNVTTGSVNALAGINDDISKLQISAQVHPGNSGGPLLNEDGLVIGMVVSKVDAIGFAKATGDMPQNINFAIKGPVLKSFLAINGVDYYEGQNPHGRTKGQASKVAQDITVKISCAN